MREETCGPTKENYDDELQLSGAKKILKTSARERFFTSSCGVGFFRGRGVVCAVRKPASIVYAYKERVYF